MAHIHHRHHRPRCGTRVSGEDLRYASPFWAVRSATPVRHAPVAPVCAAPVVRLGYDYYAPQAFVRVENHLKRPGIHAKPRFFGAFWHEGHGSPGAGAAP